ncbi:uncharacterized protein LOC142363094 [Opisthocomus hoazin]|uniref:uncharacterized protein LOC142363094 n=1 Tax=Opisthocomus hoazin TaxID=30419 RepID=UPI003F538ECC
MHGDITREALGRGCQPVPVEKIWLCSPRRPPGGRDGGDGWDAGYLLPPADSTSSTFLEGDLAGSMERSPAGRALWSSHKKSPPQTISSPLLMLHVVSERSAGVSVPSPEPVSRPQLWSRALVAQATGEVLCDVAEGRVDTITWKKDGQPLPPGRSFNLSNSLSVLYLRSAKKSDCGSYSCNASNAISWQEASLNVSIAGLSPPLQDVLRVAVVAVVFAAVSGWGLIFPVCQSDKLRIRGELWRWLSAYTCGLVCIASVLAGTAGVLWMREEGPSIATILPEIALTYVIVITFLVSANVTFQPTKFIQLKSKTAQRMMGYAAPGGVVLVVLMTSVLIKYIYRRHEEGCTEFVDVTALAVSTAAVSALPLLAIFLCYHTTQGRPKECDSSSGGKERSFEMSQPHSKDVVSTH